MQLVREHLLYPKQYADDFDCLVDIYKNEKKVGGYGFYILHIDDVCDGVLFRVTQIESTNMFDVVALNLYYAIVSVCNTEVVIKYEEKDFSFKPKTKKTKQIKT